MLTLVGASNAGGVWFGTGSDGIGIAGWLTVLAVVVVIGGLCWLGDWAVRRSVSGEEARPTNEGTIERLVDGILQTYRG